MRARALRDLNDNAMCYISLPMFVRPQIPLFSLAFTLALVAGGCAPDTKPYERPKPAPLTAAEEAARKALAGLRQCDYAHPQQCYELMQEGCGPATYGSYGSYSSYGASGTYGTYGGTHGAGTYAGAGYAGQGCVGPYSAYTYYPSSYGAYSPYSSYLFRRGSLAVKSGERSLEKHDGFVGFYANRVYFSPELQRLFVRENEVRESEAP
jgi:hypothetical protein